MIYDSVEGFHHLPGQDYIWKGMYLLYSLTSALCIMYD